MTDEAGTVTGVMQGFFVGAAPDLAIESSAARHWGLEQVLTHTRVSSVVVVTAKVAMVVAVAVVASVVV